MNQTFEGIWVPIVTPFHQGRIDTPALHRLARHLVQAGISGLVIGATTGEGCFLSTAEQIELHDQLRAVLPAEFPLVIGVNGMETAATASLARSFAAMRPAGLLVTAPPYVRPNQDGLRAHIEAVANAADLPIILYDIPYRTGVEFSIETLQSLTRDPRVVGIKSCGASIDRLMSLIHDTSLKVLVGEDSQFFAALAMGAAGAIAASAHFRPERWVRIHQLLREQRLDEARALAAPLQSVIRALFTEPNPAPIKAWLADTGWIRNELRLPFLPAAADTLARLRSLDRCLEP